MVRKVRALAGAVMLIGTSAQLAAQAPRAPQASPPQAQPARPRPTAPAVPTRVSAKMLSTLCAQDRSACLTYVLGVTDAFAAALTASNRPQAFCIPAGTTNDQIAQATVQYLRAHPEEGGSNGALVIFSGLVATYRCGY
jgi:hypothetical protein